MLMNETEELLYRRIRAYSFDGGDTRSFVQKLARDCGHRGNDDGRPVAGVAALTPLEGYGGGCGGD